MALDKSHDSSKPHFSSVHNGDLPPTSKDCAELYFVKCKTLSKKTSNCFNYLNSLFYIEIFHAIGCMLLKIWKVAQRQNLQYIIFHLIFPMVSC